MTTVVAATTSQKGSTDRIQNEDDEMKRKNLLGSSLCLQGAGLIVAAAARSALTTHFLRPLH
jgi:hypothetical protein